MRLIRIRRYIAVAISLASLCTLTSSIASASQTTLHEAPAPEVLVTLKPIHSLVAGVMQGISKPKLLIKNTQSIHHYNLRPSDRRLIANSDLFFWVGESLETFLAPILKNKQTTSQVISLIDATGIHRVQVGSHDSEHSHHTIDPHIWLSTHNASVMVKEITKQLVMIDPVHAAKYKKNRDQLLLKITSLKKSIEKQLNQHSQPYLTLHNGIRYFEKEFDLNNIASIQKNTDLQPSVSHIQHVLQLIRNKKVKCLFYNQSEQSPIINSITSDTNIRAVSIDPIGVNFKPDEETWFNIMSHLAQNLSSCFK